MTVTVEEVNKIVERRLLSMFANVLIVIVAYEAESHLPELIVRLGNISQIRDTYSVLLLDDASKDHTREYAEGLFKKAGFSKWLAVRNEQNQGYGGNQKVGYRYTLQSGKYTHVALLHGDAQYPPEAIPIMVEKALETQADVVLASRMWSIRSAWHGGMPYYKIIGNKLLTYIQNQLTKQNLSEYHTGMRLYSTELLARIPFELNSNGFDFDTEVLLQAFYVGAKVVETQIPTRYANEVCSVPGLRYAVDIIRDTFDYWLQNHGIGCSLRFRDLKGKPWSYVDKTQVKYSTHDMAVRFLIKQQICSILDLGCGLGYIGAKVKTQLPTTHWSGADLEGNPPRGYDQYWQCDFNKEIPPTNPYEYEAVLCLDILEHLNEPEEFLLRLRQAYPSNQNTIFFFSASNVAFISLRLGLLLGRFEYGDRGILNITHRRLMTRNAFIRMIRETGFTIENVIGVPAPFQLVFVRNWWTRALTIAQLPFIKILPGLFSFQTLIIARAMRGIPNVPGEL